MNHDLDHARHPPENRLRRLYPVQEGSAAPTRSGRIGKHGVRRSSRLGGNYRRRRAGQLPVSVEHLEIRPGAEPVARPLSPQHGAGARRRRCHAVSDSGHAAAESVSDGAHRGLIHRRCLALLRPPRWPEDILGAIDREKRRAARCCSGASPGTQRRRISRGTRANRPALRSRPSRGTGCARR